LKLDCFVAMKTLIPPATVLMDVNV
jgi:hypothetical protein